MKLGNISLYLAVIFLITTRLYAQNTNPVVSNVAFSISGTTVTVTYNVTDAEQSTVAISMDVSTDGGSTWYPYYDFGTATGDIGSVTTGTGKTITWNYNGGNNNNSQIRIIASDETADGSPCPGTPTVSYGGQTYNTIQIGDQCWLKENLNIGTRIDLGAQTDNGTIEKYCYNNDPANCNTYGGLYQWGEAMNYTTTEGAQGICPNGWHIPTESELQTLVTITAIDGAGYALKATSQGGGNTSGFSALLGGISAYNKILMPPYAFSGLSSETNFWSSTQYISLYYTYALNISSSSQGVSFYEATSGFSVRCIKN